MTDHSQGITRNQRGEEQPADKRRAQTVHKPDTDNAVSKEATRDPRLSDSAKTPGAGTVPGNTSDNITG